MKMHLMVDIETLGRSSHASVIEIGVARFNDMDVLDTFSQFVMPDFTTSIPDVSTLLWWCNNDANIPLHESSPTFPEVLGQLLDWLKDFPIDTVWANSPSFDLVILDNLARAHGLSMPWEFRQYRDVRTFGAIGKAYGVSRPIPEREHVAGYDAEAQAEWVIGINKMLEKGIL